MRSLRKTFEIKDGVKVDVLFTPHLYSFKGQQGVNFAAETKNEIDVLQLYADIIYCAALNAWVLDGHGEPEDFPHKRGDFHEWMTAQPNEFAKAVNFALEALTGKTLKELVSQANNAEKSTATAAPEESKKKPSNWIIRLLRHFSSENAE